MARFATRAVALLLAAALVAGCGSGSRRHPTRHWRARANAICGQFNAVIPVLPSNIELSTAAPLYVNINRAEATELAALTPSGAYAAPWSRFIAANEAETRVSRATAAAFEAESATKVAAERAAQSARLDELAASARALGLPACAARARPMGHPQ
jgi:hypothetical protein